MTRRTSLGAWLVGWLVAACLAPTAQAQTLVKVEYYHLDALGSVRMITGEQGQVIREVDYAPFGEEVSPPTSTQVNTRLFTGQQHDRETGLDYFGARYYRAGVGQFTTVDPAMTLDENLVDPQRWNRYAYVTNNPLKFTDPDGKNPVLAIVGAAWALYEIGSSIYDAYATYQTLRDPTASTAEKLTTGGLFAAGLLPGVPGGAASAERAAIRHADEIVDAATGLGRLALEGHHLLPREFRREFAAAGIKNIDDYIVAMPAELHRLKPQGAHTTAFDWNGHWRGFFKTHKNPTRAEIESFARDLWTDFLHSFQHE